MTGENKVFTKPDDASANNITITKFTSRSWKLP